MRVFVYLFTPCLFIFFILVNYVVRQVILWSTTDPETEISCNQKENSVTSKLWNLQLDLELRFHMWIAQKNLKDYILKNYKPAISPYDHSVYKIVITFCFVKYDKNSSNQLHANSAEAELEVSEKGRLSSLKYPKF